MNDYSPPLEDMQFVLSQLAGMDAVAALPAHAEVSAELVDAILREAGHFAGQVLAPLNRVGDRIGAQLVDGQVKMPPGFKQAYRQYVDAGWGGVGGPTAQGGQGLPHLVTAAIGEMWKAANLAFSSNFLLTGGAVEALSRHGSPEQIGRYLPKMVSGDWGGVMNLTEPQAGSD
ncbi:MAG: acyl-CoA dehydrogenase family protein, partial [Sulfuricaulis sp.]|nr:acyl-CoA dehydrogenase family protein [Sulfuricaulis sp.]